MKNNTSFHIERAQVSDAPAVIPLAFSALSEYAHYLAGTQDDTVAMKHMEYAFKHNVPNELHHGNFFVVRNDKGDIVSSISGYEGRLSPQFSDAIRTIYEEFCPGCIKKRETTGDPPLERDSEDNEFYIDTIAIHPDYRGMGLIELMLNHMKEQALSKNLYKLSLIAANYKTNLIKYYEKLGFKSTDERFMGAATYHHFVKEIS